MDDLKVEIYIRPKESPTATVEPRDIRIAYGDHWIVFQDGKIRITKDPKPGEAQGEPVCYPVDQQINDMYRQIAERGSSPTIRKPGRFQRGWKLKG